MKYHYEYVINILANDTVVCLRHLQVLLMRFGAKFSWESLIADGTKLSFVEPKFLSFSVASVIEQSLIHASVESIFLHTVQTNTKKNRIPFAFHQLGNLRAAEWLGMLHVAMPCCK